MDIQQQKYRMVCTLTFGDIYGQIIVWLIVIFLTLATTLALWSSTRQIYALATVGIVLVLSLPFLLFTFVTTLFNNIEFIPVEEDLASVRSGGRSSSKSAQRSATA
jgi:fatty acid desaturase